MGLHAGKEFRFDVVVSPADVEVEGGWRVGLHPPLVLFGDVFDYGILSFYMREGLPLTLIIILCFLELN